MEVALRNRDKRGFWVLPNTNLALTYDDPGPKSVDVNKLNDGQVKVIGLAIQQGVLAVRGISELKTALKKSAAKVAKPYSESQTYFDQQLDYQKQVSEKYKTDRNKLKKLLSNRVATLKVELPVKSARELRELLSIEINNKNRKSVVSLIEQLLKDKQEAVSNNIQNNETPALPINTDSMFGIPNDPRLNKELISPIEESDQSNIRITFLPEE